MKRKHSFKASGTVYTDMVCDECGAELKPVDDSSINEDGEWLYVQPEDALELDVVPGYGQYWDGLDGNAKILLCKFCADRFVRSFPRASFRVLGIREVPAEQPVLQCSCNAAPWPTSTSGCPVHGARP